MGEAPLIHVKRFRLYPEVTGGIQLVGKYNKTGEKCLQSDLKTRAWRRGYDQLDDVHKAKAESRMKPGFRLGKQSE